jgi:hypothetical protein
MAVDTVWAIISMAAVISMRGQMAPAVAIAVYNQVRKRNGGGAQAVTAPLDYVLRAWVVSASGPGSPA